MLENKTLFSRANLDPIIKDVNLWATVDTSKLTEANANRFEKLEKSISYYLAGESVVKICRDFKISRPELIRMVKRCLETHSDGRIWGFRALIPYSRQKSAEEVVAAKSEQQSNYSFGLTRLFYKFPEVKEYVDNLFLKKTEKGMVHESRIPLSSIHKRFLDKCRKVGITSDSYPFTAKQLGQISLWKYLKILFNRELKRATQVRLGKEAARNLEFQTTDSSHKELITRPYQRVEFDAHSIDAFCTIMIPSVFGGFVEMVIDRIWLLVIIDVLTRTVIGHHLSFSKQYSQDDVLLCVKNSITPWQPKKLTIPKLEYPVQGGYPSFAFDELKWAVWDEIAYDNAKSHLSERVRKRLTSVINCAINVGPVETPERRPFIERFFRTLEENGFHRLPSTTGSNIRDPRRDDPENKALRYHISLQHIEELTDVMIAKYNTTPHSGLGHRSPLECLDYFINSQNTLPRQIPNKRRNSLQLLNIEFNRTIRESGSSPHINFEGVRYRNDVLARSRHLIGTELILKVNPHDIRAITALLPNGAEFGILTAQGIWGRSLHTLEMRKAILALKNKKLIFYSESDDPVQIYLDYLGKQSPNNRKARRVLAGTQYAKRQRSAGNAKINEIKSGSETPSEVQENSVTETSKRGFIKNCVNGRNKHLFLMEDFLCRLPTKF